MCSGPQLDVLLDVMRSSPEVLHFVPHICKHAKELGWVLPSVYQGMYNPLMRQVEQEILPACEMLGVRFVAYSPLAAGLLQDPWATGGPPPPGIHPGLR